MSLAGKTALITGGASGLGKAFAKGLLDRGAKSVAILDINSEMGEETIAELGAERVKFYLCDVTNDEQVQETFQNYHDDVGQLDIVCNSAGVDQLPDWKKTIEINLCGVISCTLKAKELMLKQSEAGVIINVASAAGLYPAAMMPVYSASKHGVVGFSKSVAFEPDTMAKKLRVNTLCPTYVDTPLFQNGKTKVHPMYHAVLERVNFVPMEVVVEAFMQLVEDENQTGSVLLITPGKGIEKQDYKKPDEIVSENKVLKC